MKRPLLISLAAFAVILFAAPHQATATQIVEPPAEPRIAAKRCGVGEGRLTNIAETLDIISERRAITYTNIYERSMARVSVLKQKGYNTKKLEADLRAVDAHIKEYRSQAADLKAKVSAARDRACGDSETEYNDALQAARTQLKTVREAAQTIHQTFRSSIIPGLKTAATWVKNN